MERKMCSMHNHEFYFQCLTCNYAYLCIDCRMLHNEKHKIVNIENPLVPPFKKYQGLIDFYKKFGTNMKSQHFIFQSFEDSENETDLLSEKKKKVTEIRIIDVANKLICRNAISIDDPKLSLHVYLLVNDTLFFTLGYSYSNSLEKDQRFFCADLGKFPAEIKKLKAIPRRTCFHNLIHCHGFIYLIGRSKNKNSPLLGLKYDIKKDRWFDLPAIFITKDKAQNFKSFTFDIPVITIYENRYILFFGKISGFFDINNEESGWRFFNVDSYFENLFEKFTKVVQWNNYLLCFDEERKFYKLKFKKMCYFKISPGILLKDAFFDNFYIRKGNLWSLNYKNQIYYINLKTMKLMKYNLQACKYFP